MLWRCAIIKKTAYCYDKSLIIWRRYNTSSSSPKRKADDYKSKYMMLNDFYKSSAQSHLLFLSCLEKLISSRVLLINNQTRRILEKSKVYEEKTLDALNRVSPLNLVKTGIIYYQYIPSVKGLLWHTFVLSVLKVEPLFRKG